MSALKKLDVIFQENRTIYAPGDEVTGNVQVVLEDKLNVKGIRICFVGKAHVQWTEGGKYRYSVSGNKTYVSRFITIPCESGSLDQGTHEFPFSFRLPSGVPTSYEDDVGHVRYYIRGILERPSLSFNKNTKKIFTVLSTHNLNTTKKDMKIPTCRNASTTVCGACFQNGLIEAEVNLDKSGYVAGEWINIKGKINNRSRRNIRKISIKIIQVVTYVAQSSTRETRTTLAKEYGPGLRRAQLLNLSGVKLQIPPVPPTELTCPVLQIKYAAVIVVHMGWHTPDLRVYAPFTVGTVPVDSPPLYSSLKPAATSPSSSQRSDNETPPPSYEAPPPSYEEALGIEFDGRDVDDDENTMGVVPYRPRYTFYNWDKSTFLNAAYQDDEN